MTQKFPVYFDRFTLELTQDKAESGSHSGQCDDDIAALLELPEIAAQIDALSPEDEEPESVTLIASGYEFICPACDTYNHVIETSETVTCGECGKTFVVDEAIHAHG